MKKLIVSILAIVYISTSVDAIVHLHYCMGKLESWGVSDKSDAKCSFCGMHKGGHKGCCHDEQKLVKIQNDQKITGQAFQLHNIYSLTTVVQSANYSIIYSSSIGIKNPSANSPPRSGAVPVFILNCNFLI